MVRINKQENKILRAEGDLTMNNKIASLLIATALLAAIGFAALAITTHASDTITSEQAKQIAVQAAGFKTSNVTFVKNEYGFDDGVAEYEIDFYHGNTKYEYDIDATTGAIRSFDQDFEATAPVANTKVAAPKANAVAAPKEITSDQALRIAMEHAGVAQKDISFPEVKKDFDDGKQIYEVEFHVGLTEYSYDIDAATGAVLDFDIDD